MSAIGYTLEELLPHAGPMILLDEVVSVSADAVHARTRPRDDGRLAPAGEGGLPAWMGMEYLAQSIAAWSGFHELEQGRPVRPGFLVGARSFHSSAARLPCGVELDVTAERLFEDRDGISVFDGRVSGEGVEQHTRIKVFLPPDLDAYLRDLEDG